MSDYYDTLNDVFREFLDVKMIDLLGINLGDINNRIRKHVNKVIVIKMTANRIGHMAINTEDFLRRFAFYEEEHRKKRELIILENDCVNIANHQLYKMIRRRFPVIRSVMPSTIIQLLAMADPDLWNLENPRLYDSDLNNLDTFCKMPPQLSFTKEEEKIGEELLRSMGIKKDDRFICFHTRDKAYMDKEFGEHTWGYHDYRDNDIENYIPSVQFLASHGYYCIRMGHTVEKPLLCDNPKIIDYASNFRSDFGDIYLSSKCKFFLGASTGIIHIAQIFNVPVIITNVIPIMLSKEPIIWNENFSNNNIVLYKKAWYKPEKRFLTIRELLDAKIHHWGFQSNNYSKLGIDVVQNTPDEILDVTKEMVDRVNNKFENYNDDIQKNFRELFIKDGNNYLPPVRIGTEFYLKNMSIFQ